jgi:hypothetical protein
MCVRGCLEILGGATPVVGGPEIKGASGGPSRMLALL